MSHTTGPASSSTHQNQTRAHKTHSSEAVAAALKNLPRANKIKKNEIITGNNAERALQNAKHDEEPDTYAPASDDESFITVSEAEEEMSPATRVLTVISKLTPSSARDVIRSFLPSNKHSRELTKGEEEGRKAAKRIRAEVNLQPGMSLPLAFHALLRDLYYRDIYIPLSLFTSANLEIINSSAATLTLRKINGPSPGDKQPRILDTAAFEAAHLYEIDLKRGQWSEGSRNYVSFLVEVSGDPASPICARFHAHFGFFEHVEDAEENYPAILSTDIALRRKYATVPFMFSAPFYRTELEKAVTSMHIKAVEKIATANTTSFQAAGPSNQTISSGGGGGHRGGRGGGRGRSNGGGFGARGGAPFQQGSGGDGPGVVCLICSVRGHYWDHCRAEDKSVFFSSPSGRDLVTKSGQALCRAWNAKGNTTSCSHDNQRAHLCSYCGSKDHHAFSWSCRRCPPN
ncbi:hypothetical protein C8R43DRAFT_715387 [Mycena crocata]|nr:hypothetical protein C8R43DRAFT_715387 [Mycena crocata]